MAEEPTAALHAGLSKAALCRPRLKMHMDYCMEHPEELTKVAAVQKKVQNFLVLNASDSDNRLFQLRAPVL